MNEMTKLCYDVSDAEVARAKNQLKSSLMFFQDSTHRECCLLSPAICLRCVALAITGRLPGLLRASERETALYLSIADVAESIGRELLVYGRRLPKAELFARIDAVDGNTIRAVADRFIYDQDMAVAAVGDVQFMVSLTGRAVRRTLRPLLSVWPFCLLCAA